MLLCLFKQMNLKCNNNTWSEIIRIQFFFISFLFNFYINWCTRMKKKTLILNVVVVVVFFIIIEIVPKKKQVKNILSRYSLVSWLNGQWIFYLSDGHRKWLLPNMASTTVFDLIDNLQKKMCLCVNNLDINFLVKISIL